MSFRPRPLPLPPPLLRQWGSWYKGVKFIRRPATGSMPSTFRLQNVSVTSKPLQSIAWASQLLYGISLVQPSYSVVGHSFAYPPFCPFNPCAKIVFFPPTCYSETSSPLVTLHHKYTLLFACCPMPLRNPTPSFHFLFQAAKAPQALCAKRSWVVVVCVSPSLARNESAGQPWALRNLSFRHVTVSKKPRGLYGELQREAVYPSSEITD